MDHKDWGTDDFLDDFLDFDYKKPVPDHQSNKQSEGLHTDKTTAKNAGKNYGLSEDSYKEYERLRHGDNYKKEDAEQRADGSQRSVQSLGAFSLDIPEPLSARNAAGKSASKPAPSDAGSKASASAKGEGGFKFSSPFGAKSGADKEKSEKKSPHMPHIASGVAADAFKAAKKLVSTDEDVAPEEVPAASSAADLFAELGGDPARVESRMSPEENKALLQAQEEAYDRYRGKYSGKKKKFGRPNSSGKVGAFPRWLSRIYVITLFVFAGILMVMNVLPFGMLIALYIVLGLLSIIILAQLRKRNIGKSVRVLASMTAILLIAFFGVGTAYAMGTLSFLDATSVKNEKKVAHITRQPFNVCITGLDVYGKIDEQGRSDVNMILTVNPSTSQVLMTSIPRDYQIYMPDKDFAMDKLTHTGFYSVDTTIAAEENLLDTEINYYIKINFSTVKAFIYAIGGIDVYSEYEFSPVKMPDWTVKKGWNHMNGKQALAFARERKAFIDGDNQRIKNQQAVFEAIIKKATSSKTMVLSYNRLLTNLKDNFRMSISSGELRSLIKLQLARDPDWKIFKNTLVGGNDLLPTYTTGNAAAYVMTQDEESIENARKLINAVLEGKTLDKDDDNNVFVVGEEEETEETGETEEQ